jgi:hypothetical protein
MTHSFQGSSLAEMAVRGLIPPLSPKDFSYRFFTLFNPCHLRTCMQVASWHIASAWHTHCTLFTVKIVTV